jgi:hypothetical protein
MDTDDEIESWASIVLGLMATVFFFIGVVAVIVSVCMAWGYYSYQPQCGSAVSRLTQECKK